MAGTSGAFGGAGWAAAGGRAALAAAGEPFSAGATRLPVGALVGSAGLTAALVNLSTVLSALSCLAAPGRAVLVPAVVAGFASFAEAIALSDCALAPLLGKSEPVFAVAGGCVSPPAGAL